MRFIGLNRILLISAIYVSPEKIVHSSCASLRHVLLSSGAPFCMHRKLIPFNRKVPTHRRVPFSTSPIYLETENGTFKWLPVICKMILYFVHSLCAHENVENMRKAIDDMGGDDVMHMLWQAFVPGSWTEEPSFIKKIANLDQHISISDVLVRSWQPLVHDKPVLIYSTVGLSKLEIRKWSHRRPASTISSTLIIDAKEKAWYSRKNAPLVLFHTMQDVSADLNYELIKMITRGFNIRSNNGVLDVVPKTSIPPTDLLSITNSLSAAVFPGKISVSNPAQIDPRRHYPTPPKLPL